MRSGLVLLVLVGMAACDLLNKPMTSPGPMTPLGAPAQTAPPPLQVLDAGVPAPEPNAAPTAQPGDVQL